MTVRPIGVAMTLYTHVPSPIGELLLVGDETHLRGVYMPPHRWGPEVTDDWQRADEPFAAVRDQLEAYFAGERRDFDLPLAAEGTPFRQRVWAALREIPYGETWSYGQLADHIGQPTAARAVGLANGRNPLSIIVPCHRVIGANRSLTGYGGGLDRKQALLAHETAVVARGGGL